MIRPASYRSKIAFLVTALALLTAPLAGCGPDTSKPVPTDTQVVAPSATAQVTTVVQTATVVVAATPSPTVQAATATPAATNTATVQPSPTATQTPTATPTQVVLDVTWSRVGLTNTKLTSMSLLPHGNNTVLVGGAKGVWRSQYNYTKWQLLNVKPVGPAAEVAVGSEQVMYLASHTGCASGLPISDSRSTDGGATWQEMPKLGAIRIVAANGTEAFALTCSGVMKTADGGATWTALPNLKVENLDPSSIAVSPDGQQIFVAFVSEGGEGQIVRSTDGGLTMTKITPPNAESGEGFTAPDNLVFVPGSQGHPQEGGLYLTTYQAIWFLPDGGSDWKTLKKPVSPGDAGTGADYTFYTTLFVDTAYSADYNKPGPVIYTSRAKPGDKGLSNIGVFRTVDNGETWALVGKTFDAHSISTLVLAPHDPTANPGMVETLLAAGDDGVWAIPLPPPFK